MMYVNYNSASEMLELPFEVFTNEVFEALEAHEDAEKLVVDVRENQGGRPNHYGDTRNFELPNSKLRVRYSTKFIQKLDEDIELLEPDISIGVSAKLESQGRDGVLEWISAQE